MHRNTARHMKKSLYLRAKASPLIICSSFKSLLKCLYFGDFFNRPTDGRICTILFTMPVLSRRSWLQFRCFGYGIRHYFIHGRIDIYIRYCLFVSRQYLLQFRFDFAYYLWFHETFFDRQTDGQPHTILPA